MYYILSIHLVNEISRVTLTKWDISGGRNEQTRAILSGDESEACKLLHSQSCRKGKNKIYAIDSRPLGSADLM